MNSRYSFAKKGIGKEKKQLNISGKKLKGLSKRISLDLRNMDIVDVFKFLAEEGNLNIVVGKDVAGRISIFVKDISIKEILEILIQRNSLAYEIKENTIQIISQLDWELTHGSKFTDRRIVSYIQLEHAPIKALVDTLKRIKSSTGNIIIDQDTNTLILIDTPEKVTRMEEILEKAKHSKVMPIFPTTTIAFDLKYANAEEVLPAVNNVITTGIGLINLDKRTNTLIVTDTTANMKNIEALIATLDTKTQQVLIQAKIIQVRLNDSYQEGINWETLFAQTGNLNIISSFPASPTLAAFQKITVGKVEDNDVTATFEFLKSIGKANILSTPSITTLNNQEAKILVGTREAYVTQTVSQSTVTTTTSENIEFIDVGIKLYVTPTINSDGYVKLKIKPEVSTVLSTLTTPNGSSIPIVDTSETETTVMVRDGVTIVLAGLIKDEKVNDERKVPVLGDIPLLGALFRSKTEKTVKTELLVLITPHIVSGDEDITSIAAIERKTKPLRHIEEEREEKPLRE